MSKQKTCNPSDCGNYTKVKGKKPLCLKDYKECECVRIYTKEEILNRTSNLICFPCGNQFLTKCQKSGKHPVKVITAECGLCGEKTSVVNYKFFNCLIRLQF